MIACLCFPRLGKQADVPLRVQVALLAIVPRIQIETVTFPDLQDEFAIAWVDIRGMAEAEAMARIVSIVRRAKLICGIGIAAIPIAASVAGATVARRIVRHVKRYRAALARHRDDPKRFAKPTKPVVVHMERVAVGGEQDFLAPLVIGVLGADPTLANLLDGAGIEFCRDLARVSRESVEVRFGSAGAALWRLARADDPRIVFDLMPRMYPEASLEWSEYAIKRVERLIFVINGLCGSICQALASLGEGATAVTVRFSLANRTVFEHPVRAARPTSSQSVWMRILRLALEELTLPDAVVGITMRVDALGPLGDKQGDLFDRGFATARAAEAGVSQVLDDQPGVVVLARNTEHPVIDRRTTWMPVDAATALEDGDARLGSSSIEPMLTLQLLPRPQRIAVSTIERRGLLLPQTYRDGSATHAIVDVAGPDRVSGAQWDRPYARDYYRCVTTEGRLVWLYHDVPEHAWYLHGWWD